MIDRPDDQLVDRRILAPGLFGQFRVTSLADTDIEGSFERMLSLALLPGALAQVCVDSRFKAFLEQCGSLSPERDNAPLHTEDMSDEDRIIPQTKITDITPILQQFPYMFVHSKISLIYLDLTISYLF